MALPVFKIGRSPPTRGGWVRLPGASANFSMRRKVILTWLAVVTWAAVIWGLGGEDFAN